MNDELASDIELSRIFEMETYLSSLGEMYSQSMSTNEELYDTAAKLTKDFTSITSVSILKDSRIIKILRYAIAPSISQMKFGQFFGMKSVKKFEEKIILTSSKMYKELENISEKMAEFVNDNIDLERFRWILIEHDLEDVGLAKEYAKKWTCSIASDQNAQTAYRNWRKEIQEKAIATQLEKMGYEKMNGASIIVSNTDIIVGKYTTEKKVKGRTTQKADAIARSKKTGNKLTLIEAKAVGVELDSTKRIKECCDKANDWRYSKELMNPQVVAVIAGFFTDRGIQNLRASDIEVVWEHRLSDLSVIL